jgi:hypothetical protein
MQKKGVSQVVTTLIILLVVIVAVGIVAAVIYNMVSKGQENVEELGQFNVNLEVEKVLVDDSGDTQVVIERKQGNADLTGLKFVVSDGLTTQEISYTFPEEDFLEEFDKKEIPLEGLNILVRDVAVIPLIGASQDPAGAIEKELSKRQVYEANGAVSYWALDGNADDAIGSNNGQIMGGADCSVEGRVGGACDFDGTDDYILISDNFDTSDLQGDFSFSAWIKADNFNNYKRIISIRSNYIDTNSFESDLAFHTANGDSLIFYATSGGYVLSTAKSINEWYHVVGVKKGTSLKMYVDGKIDGPTNRNSNYVGKDGRATIGRAFYAEAFFNGKIDEVAIFKKALSADEVAALYAIY